MSQEYGGFGRQKVLLVRWDDRSPIAGKAKTQSTTDKSEDTLPEFRPLSEAVFASEQIALADISAARTAGVTTIVNNRPDGEDPGAPQSDAIEAEATAAGLKYVSIPIGHSGFSEWQVDAMVAAIKDAEGGLLAYCRSGTRSTFLWALASAKMGSDPDAITQAALAAGYDVSPIRPMMDMLAAR